MKRIPYALLVLPLIGACSSAPRYRTATVDTPPPVPIRSQVVRVAKSYLGTPYRAGGTTHSGLDCSGLIIAVYRDFDILLPRTSLHQSTMGKRVDRSDLKPADLVFFRTSRRSPISHVGIYIGANRFIHASTRVRRVRIDRLDSSYFRKRFVTARRIVD